MTTLVDRLTARRMAGLDFGLGFHLLRPRLWLRLSLRPRLRLRFRCRLRFGLRLRLRLEGGRSAQL